MDENEHSVYLTFDDGPIPESTPYILKTLREFGIKATFFVVGDNVRKYPDLYRQIIEDGHQVGNHTYNHIGSARHSIKSFDENVEKCFRIMAEQSPLHDGDNAADHSRINPRMVYNNLFRPPHGWMRHTLYWRYKNKLRIVMWDLVTRDYSKLLSPYDVVRNVKNYTRNGSIITFHDSLKSIDKLYFALPASLRWLKSQGYEFRTFD